MIIFLFSIVDQHIFVKDTLRDCVQYVRKNILPSSPRTEERRNLATQVKRYFGIEAMQQSFYIQKTNNKSCQKCAHVFVIYLYFVCTDSIAQSSLGSLKLNTLNTKHFIKGRLSCYPSLHSNIHEQRICACACASITI